MTPPDGPVRVLERRGGLVRLAGIDGWFCAADLVACRSCGGRLFGVRVDARGRAHGLACLACVKPGRGERLLGKIEMPEKGGSP